MRDIVSIERANKLHPAVRQEVIDTITQLEAEKLPANIAVRIVQGYRTFAEQAAIYAQGRTAPGKIVTKAKPGSSFHQYAISFDFALMYDKDGNGIYEELSWDINKDGDKDGIKDWNEVIAAFEAKGWESGSRWRTFKDYPHIQKSFGYTWKQLLEKYNKKDFIPGTEYVNIS